MTQDVIALTRRMPDPRAIVNGLLAAGPDLRLHSVADGAVIQLCDDADRPLLSVEAPLLLRVPGEAARLLGPDAPDIPTPAWWTEARASTAVPGAERLAAAFATRLAHDLDGAVWPKSAAVEVPKAPQPSASTPPVPVPAAAQPAVDVLTDRVAVVIQDRPVLPLTAWLADTLRVCHSSGRGLQIVTPAHTRLSLPLRTMLGGLPSRWVVRDPAVGYYDGLSGAVLHWHDGAFTPTTAPATPAAAFTAAPPGTETQLTVSLRTRHSAGEALLLGGAAEASWQALTGAPPGGWSTAEPVSHPWSRTEITELARRRAPDGTWLTAVSTPPPPSADGPRDRTAIATTRVSRTKDAVEEDVILAIGYRSGEQPPLDALTALADELITAHHAQTVLVQRRTARADLTVPPLLEPPPNPVAFAIGHDAVHEIGPSRAGIPPLPHPPVRIGHTTRPGLYYPLGDGTSATAWTAFEHLMRHLRPDPDSTTPK